MLTEHVAFVLNERGGRHHLGWTVPRLLRWCALTTCPGPRRSGSSCHCWPGSPLASSRSVRSAPPPLHRRATSKPSLQYRRILPLPRWRQRKRRPYRRCRSRPKRRRRFLQPWLQRCLQRPLPQFLQLRLPRSLRQQLPRSLRPSPRRFLDLLCQRLLRLLRRRTSVIRTTRPVFRSILMSIVPAEAEMDHPMCVGQCG